MKTPVLQLYLSALACGVLWPLAGCSPQPNPQAAAPVVTGLSVAQATLVQVPEGVTAVGTVHARESATLSAQVVGRVTAVMVHEGDTVRAGQMLVRLDEAAAGAELDRARAGVVASEQQLAAAQTQAALASSTLERYKQLRERKSVSPQEYDEVDRRAQVAAAQVEAAHAQVEETRAAANGARTASGYSSITAPFAGLVTGRHVDPGALASPGMPLVDVDRAGPLQLHVSVDESLLQILRLGEEVNVDIASASSAPIQGRVAQIVPAADAASRTFLVKIDLPASTGLRTGMYGSAHIGTSSRNALMIPLDAIVTHGSLQSMWVLNERGIASLRYVTLGKARAADVEVLSGISSGERVVLAPGDRELGGSRIEVRP
jgi:RND family efflux transporter MFP subunit